MPIEVAIEVGDYFSSAVLGNRMRVFPLTTNELGWTTWAHIFVRTI